MKGIEQEKNLMKNKKISEQHITLIGHNNSTSFGSWKRIIFLWTQDISLQMEMVKKYFILCAKWGFW